MVQDEEEVAPEAGKDQEQSEKQEEPAEEKPETEDGKEGEPQAEEQKDNKEEQVETQVKWFTVHHISGEVQSEYGTSRLSWDSSSLVPPCYSQERFVTSPSSHHYFSTTWSAKQQLKYLTRGSCRFFSLVDQIQMNNF